MIAFMPDVTKPSPEPILIYHLCGPTDIRKSTGPRSSTGENSGGPMKAFVVLVLLSGKTFLKGALNGDSYVKKNYIRSCKSFGGPVKLGFSIRLPFLRSGKGPKVFLISGLITLMIISWGKFTDIAQCINDDNYHISTQIFVEFISNSSRQ